MRYRVTEKKSSRRNDARAWGLWALRKIRGSKGCESAPARTAACDLYRNGGTVMRAEAQGSV